MLGSQRRRVLRRGRRGSLTKLASWRCLGLAFRLLLRCQLPVGSARRLFAIIDHRTVCSGFRQTHYFPVVGSAEKERGRKQGGRGTRRKRGSGWISTLPTRSTQGRLRSTVVKPESLRTCTEVSQIERFSCDRTRAPSVQHRLTKDDWKAFRVATFSAGISTTMASDKCLGMVALGVLCAMISWWRWVRCEQ